SARCRSSTASTARSSTSARAEARPASRSPWRCPGASSRCSRRSGGSATSSAAGRRRTRPSSGGAPRCSRSRASASRSRRRSPNPPWRSSGACRSSGPAARPCCLPGGKQTSNRSSGSPGFSEAGRRRTATGSSSSRSSSRRRPASPAASASRRSVRSPSDNERAMSRIYALANQKGGVGKTTTAVNLAACLAEAGERALVIDLDPQANATSGLGMRANGTSSYDLLDGAPLADLVKPTAFANLDLVPSKPDLAGAVVELARRDDGEHYLAEALASGSEQYDFVFLDCPPSLGPL